MNIVKFTLTAFLTVFSFITIADETAPSSAFEDFLSSNQRIAGSFNQIISSESGEVVQSASGNFWIKQPNKFRWDYNKPYVQKIISNGSKVWIYDEDLEQVTVKQVSAAKGASPLAIFDASKPLQQSFVVNQLPSSYGIEWLQLIPKGESSSFESIKVGLLNKQLKYMNMQDHFGQLTELTFSQLSTPTSIEQAVFEFRPPEGVDVFEE